MANPRLTLVGVKRIGAILGMLVLVLGIAVVLGLSTFGQESDSTSAPPAPTEAGIPEEATPAVVNYVHDGDTLFLDDGRKVRMLGIDTPEIGANLACYGPEATDILRELLPEGTMVWVLGDVEPTDRYGRSLLFVYLEDGTNVNLEMVERGAARVEMYAPNLLFESEIRAAEDAARDADLGLWSECH